MKTKVNIQDFVDKYMDVLDEDVFINLQKAALNGVKFFETDDDIIKRLDEQLKLVKEDE